MENRGFDSSSEQVRKLFFPRWDRARRWRFLQVEDLNGAMGRCIRTTKTIMGISGISGNRLMSLLIHETAHAVTEDGHGKR